MLTNDVCLHLKVSHQYKMLNSQYILIYFSLQHDVLCYILYDLLHKTEVFYYVCLVHISETKVCHSSYLGTQSLPTTTDVIKSFVASWQAALFTHTYVTAD